MDPSRPPLTPTKKSWTDRLQALIEILLLCGILSSVLAFLPFSLSGKTQSEILRSVQGISSFALLETTITLGLLFLVLRVHGERIGKLGWNPKNWFYDTAIGLAIIPVLILINLTIAYGFKLLLPEYFMDHNPLMETIESSGDLLLFIVTAVAAGGVKEEIQRGFILTRFREHLGGAGIGLWLWSIAFGAGHYVQGLQAIVVASIFGLLLGAVYLARGSLLAPMVAHGAYDTLALVAYWSLKGGGD